MNGLFQRLAPAAVLGAVILVPIAWVITRGSADIGEVLGSADLESLLSVSIFLALLTTVLALLLGVPLALLLNLRSFPGRTWIGRLYFLPLVIPPHIHTIAWTRVLGDRGWLTGWMESSLGWELDVRAPLGDLATPLGYIYPGPAWIMACAYFPLVTLALSAGVRALDAEAIAAARVFGGRRLALRRVILPQVAPRILAGAFFVFVLSLSTYPVVSLLDTPALIQKVFFTFAQVNQEAGALLALPLVLVAALAAVFLGVAESRSRRRQTGLQAPERVPCGAGTTLLALLPILLAAGVPLVSLLIEAGPLSFGSEPDNYQKVFERVPSALSDSLRLTMLGVPLLLAVSYPLGRLLAQRRAPWLEGLGVAYLAFPPVVIGVVLKVFWSQGPGEMTTEFAVGVSLVAGLLVLLGRRMQDRILVSIVTGVVCTVVVIWADGSTLRDLVYDGGRWVMDAAYPFGFWTAATAWIAVAAGGLRGLAGFAVLATASQLLLAQEGTSLVTHGYPHPIPIAGAFCAWLAVRRCAGQPPDAWLPAAVTLAGAAFGVLVIDSLIVIDPSPSPGIALLMLALLARFLPFTVRLFRNGLQALDPDEMQAARVCGHGRLSRMARIELPRIQGVAGAAAVLGYVLCITELAATLMVIPQGRQSVQVRIFNMIHYREVGEVAALCVIVIILAALPVLLFAILGRRKVDVL